jgi:hypothetical protein
MVYTAPTVKYANTKNGSYATIPGVQSVTITRGRQRFQDPFPPTVCTIELIPTVGYEFFIGQFLDVRDIDAVFGKGYFVGKITDVQRKYDFPYKALTGDAPGDRIILTCLGGTGLLGLQTFTNYSWITDTSAAVSKIIADAAGIKLDNTLALGTAQASAQTYNGSVLEALNKLCVTGQFYLCDFDDFRTVTVSTEPRVYILPPGQNGTLFTFRDDGGSGYKYTNIEYLSSIQNSFTQVQVNPDGLASQSASTGSAPYNTLVQNTYNTSTSDASSLASYLLAVNQQASPVPFVITSTTAAQSDIADLCDLTYHPLGNLCTVIFRGSTVSASLEGMSATFYLDHASVTCYLAPTLGLPFILDSASNGVLDTNRLGYP